MVGGKTVAHCRSILCDVLSFVEATEIRLRVLYSLVNEWPDFFFFLKMGFIKKFNMYSTYVRIQNPESYLKSISFNFELRIAV